MFFGDMPIDSDKMTVCKGRPRGELDVLNENKGWRLVVIGMLTTLAALAATSRSEDRQESVRFIEASNEGERRETSRLHSVASALNMARVTKRELKKDGSSLIGIFEDIRM